MNNMKPRPQMKRKPFRKNNNRTDNRRYGMNNGSSNNNMGNGSMDFENGADQRSVKNAQVKREKYLDLARNALADGDRVQAENCFQHADHYLRIINSAEPVQRPAYQPRATNETNNNAEPQINGNNLPESNGNNAENNAPEQHLPAFLKTREPDIEQQPEPPIN